MAGSLERAEFCVEQVVGFEAEVIDEDFFRIGAFGDLLPCIGEEFVDISIAHTVTAAKDLAEGFEFHNQLLRLSFWF